MKFLAGFLRRKSVQLDDPVDFSHPRVQAAVEVNDPPETASPQPLPSQTPRARVNRTRMLGFDDDGLPQVDDLEAPIPSPRGRQNRTRMIGFDHLSDDMAEPSSAPKPTLFPVGFVLVTKGPGRGNCFALMPGKSQIGRAADQAIALDFGDTAISRQHHAAIVYDPDTGRFILGHGGKTNLVRLNGEPLLSNRDMSDHDRISIGETELTLKMICDDSFDWSEPYTLEEQGNVAIA